jgi:hypothetical protein
MGDCSREDKKEQHMPRTQEKRPRASNGRFVKRTRSAAKKSAGPAGRDAAQSDVSAHQSDAVRHSPSSRREGSVRLALLTLAILFAALGFALSFFWIAALVLMGVLWGAMIAERPQRQGTVTGLVSEMVTAVVDEAREVTDPGSDSDAVTQPSPVGDARTTAG